MVDFNAFEENWFNDGSNPEVIEELGLNEEATVPTITSFLNRYSTRLMTVLGGVLSMASIALATDSSQNDSSNIDSSIQITAPFQVSENSPGQPVQLAEPQELQNTDSQGQLGQQPPAQPGEGRELQRLIVRNPGLTTINYTSALPGALIPNPDDLTALSIPINELAGKRLSTSAMNTGINIRQIQNGELVDTTNNLSRNFNQLTATGQVVIGVETNENGSETPIAFLQVTTSSGNEMWISGTSLRQYRPSLDRVANREREVTNSQADQQEANSDTTISNNNSSTNLGPSTDSTSQNLDAAETGADLVEVIQNPSDSEVLELIPTQTQIQVEAVDTQLEPEEVDRPLTRTNSTREEYELALLGFDYIARQAREFLSNTDATPEQNSRLFSIEALSTELSDTSALQGLVRGGHSIADLWIILPNVTRLREEILTLGRLGIILEIPESLNEVFSYEFAIPELVQRPVVEINRRLENLLVGFGDFKRMLNTERVNQFIYNNQEATSIVQRLKDQIDTSLDSLAIVMAMNINQTQPIIGPFDEVQTLLDSYDTILTLVQQLYDMEFTIAMPDSITNNISLSYLIPELQYGNSSADSVVPAIPAQDTPLDPSTNVDPIDETELDLPTDSKNSYQKFIDELSDSTLNQQYIGCQFEYTAKNGKTAVYTFKGLTKTGKIELKMPNSNLSIKINPSTLKSRPNSISEVEFVNWDDVEFTELSDSIEDIQYVTNANIVEVTD